MTRHKDIRYAISERDKSNEMEGEQLEPDELLSRLKSLGQDVSRPTLPRWVRQGLIPAPDVRSLGRGLGAQSLYPACALAEAFAAAVLLRERGCKVREVAFVRQAFYLMAKEDWAFDDHSQGLQTAVLLMEAHPAMEWPVLVAKVSLGWDLAKPASIALTGRGEDGCLEWEGWDSEKDQYIPTV